MIEPGVLYDKIASLDCADEIAAFLGEQGVKGIPQEPHSCAIAIYFHSNTERFWEVNDHVRAISGEETEFPCTQAMNDFIRNFDDEQYHSLIHEDHFNNYYDTEEDS